MYHARLSQLMRDEFRDSPHTQQENETAMFLDDLKLLKSLRVLNFEKLA